MILSKIGFKYAKNGILLKKPISILNNANYIVHVQCDECNTRFSTLWTNRKKRISSGKTDLCNSCSKSGNRNSQHGKDRKEITRYSRSFVKNFARCFTSETKKQMSETRTRLIAEGAINIQSSNRGVKQWHFSIKNNQHFHADSLLELFRMIQLDNDASIINWTKRHKIKIKYCVNGIIKYTTPDFLITTIDGIKIIEEVKGRVTEIEEAKKKATLDYCMANSIEYKFITQKQLNENGQYRRFIKERKQNN